MKHEKTTEETTEQMQQISNKAVTVWDVINSQAFDAAIDNAIPKQYLVSAEQIQASEESGGINIYGITDASGETTQFTVKNGEKGDTGATPNVVFTVNFNTGKLDYTTS